MNSSSPQRDSHPCRECGVPLSAEALESFCPACLLEGALKVRSSPPLRPPTQADAAQSSSEGLGTLFGDYDLIEEIARGGMGIVYRARQRSLNRIVALKLILTGQFASKQEILRFRAEAEMAARLHHTNIVAVHETGEHQGQHYFSMDFVPGRSLAEIVRDGGPLPGRRAAEYVRAVATAISYAHSQGVLHRDLKPSNVLIDAEDRPRITDFGLAKHMRDEFGLTVTGQLLGSPNFMPPEQGAGSANELEPAAPGPSDARPLTSDLRASNSQLPAPSSEHPRPRLRAGPASDVYGIGAILYHLLTGRPPFQAATIPEVLVQLRQSEPISPRRLNASVPRDLETICLKCLEKDPACRYAAAQEIAEELSRFLEDEPILARPVSCVEQGWRWCRRRPALATLGAVAEVFLLVIMIGAPIAFIRINRENAKFERSLYAAEMKLASEAVRNGTLRFAQDLLSRHRPRSDKSASVAFEWRYLLHSVSEREARRTFTGLSVPTWDSSALVCVAGVLYNTGADQIRAWKVADWTPVALTMPSTAGSLRWWSHPAHETLFGLDSASRTLTVYRLPDCQKVSVIPLRLPAISAEISADKRVVAMNVQDTNGHRVLVWDLAQNVERGAIGEPADNAAQLQFSPDSSVLALVQPNSGVSLWEALTLAPLPRPPKIQSGPPPKVTFSPTGHRLAIGQHEDDHVVVWDWVTGESLPFRYREGGFVAPLQFSPNGRVLVTGCIDNSLVVLDARTMQQLGTLRGHHTTITALAFSPNGNLLASGSMEHSAKLWDLNLQREIATLGGHGNNKIDDLTFLPDGQTLVAVSNAGEIKVWDLPKVIKGNVLLTNLYPSWRFAISPNGLTLAAQYHEQDKNMVGLWDRFTGQVIHSIPAPDPVLGDLAFAPDGRALTWVTPRTLEVFDIRTAKPHPVPVDRTYEFQGFVPVAFSPATREIAFTCQSNVMLCELSSRRLETFTSCNEEPYALAYSPDGALLAVGLNKGAVAVWDRKSARKLSEELAHTNLTACVTFSPDGRWLASCGTLTIKLWRVTRNGLERYKTLEGHAGYIPVVAFSPDGKRLVSASSDQTLRLWDTADGKEVGTLYGHTAWISDVEFSRDGNTIFSISQDGTLRTWEAPPLRRRAEGSGSISQQ